MFPRPRRPATVVPFSSFFFSSRRRHTRCSRDWSSDVCSSDLLSVLAAGLDREVVLCLQGTASGDSAMVRDFVMPDLLSSAADAVQPLPCAPATLAVWHNHPWTGPDSSFGVKTPEDFCSLSEPDLRTVIADSIPFAVVSVGRARRPILCWWRRVQAVVNRHVKFLPRFPRQWLEVSSLAAIDTFAP